MQPSGKPPTLSLPRLFSHVCTDPIASPDGPRSRAEGRGDLLFGVPSQQGLICPELIAVENISFSDLCQTTFYLIPGVYPVERGCGQNPETRQTHRGKRD